MNVGSMPVQIAVRFGIFWTTGYGDRQTQGTQTGSARDPPQRHHRICNLQGDQDVLQGVHKEGGHDPNGRGSRTAHALEKFLGHTRRYQGQH